jgi:uncharacterized RDD family membrane protein YckC
MTQPPDERGPMPQEEPSATPPDEQPTVAWTPPDEPAVETPQVDASPPDATAGDAPVSGDVPIAPATPAAPPVPAEPGVAEPGAPADPQNPLISWAPSGGAAAGGAVAGGTPADGAVVGWAAPTDALPPSGVEGYQTAGVGPRIVAWVLDGFLVILAALLLFAILGAVLGPSLFDDEFLLNAMFVVIVLGLEFLYFVGFWTGAAAATPGMRLLALRIVSSPGGGSFEIGPAVVRWLAFGYPLSIVSLIPVLGSFASYALTGWTIVLLLTTAMSDTNQGLHDRWAGSAIVRRIGAPNNTALIGCLVIALIVVALFIVLPILALLALGPQLDEILSAVGESI